MRVIAGTHRGRRLTVPKGLATRPTSDRARETLFALLGDLGGTSFLDLFAGSGAVGIEALSRGARPVYFVESARSALTALHANLRSIGASTDAEIVPYPLPATLDRVTGTFNVVFLDPPYAEETLLAATLARLLGAALLAPGGVVVVEHAARHPPVLPPGLVVSATRRVGDTAFTFAHRADDAQD
jgi:16S rRNA (guanine966-N2)-methyltransferase